MIDPETKVPLFDGKGRPLWDMSRAKVSEIVTHNGIIKQGSKYVRGEIQVPVYRALSAQDARFIRAQIRRMKRKEDEEKARKEAESAD